METFQKSNNEVTNTLSDESAWGLLRPLRGDFLSLAEEFRRHLNQMSGAVDGARERLHTTSATYGSAEAASLGVLAETGRTYGDGKTLRELNPVSGFYQNHHAWYGVIMGLPASLGSIGNSALHGWRLFGDLSSDDKYNTGTDIAMFATDATAAILSTRADVQNLLIDPLGLLIRSGLSFLLNAFYWTKKVTDLLTGDPMATGQAAYGFDSIAEGCRRLAADIGSTSHRLLDDRWQGVAAEDAGERLRDLTDGINDTARSADGIAALLQVISSLIADVEAIVRGMITSLVTWAVMLWFSAQLAAVETAGASEAVALQDITVQSGQTAGEVGRLLALLTSLIRRARGLVSRVRAEFQRVNERSFAALAHSGPGKSFIDSKYGGGRQNMAVLREDAVHGRHAKVDNVHILVSTGKQASRTVVNGFLLNFGFLRSRYDSTGTAYPNGQRRIRVRSYQVPDGNGKYRELRNPVGVAGSIASTALPLGRALQYWHRGSGGAPASDTDRELDLWTARE
ncbi:hypothetical protein [Actinoallomurus acaciae]|uniref:WXG100 family type VII secretion target n=1 Tax=Actinoallomurus acaciae TaxID=502577 RepID=A0ABV5YNW8_9ACTN